MTEPVAWRAGKVKGEEGGWEAGVWSGSRGVWDTCEKALEQEEGLVQQSS